MTYSSYGNPKKMSGGYWTIGAGYRQLKADWLRTAVNDAKVRHLLKGSGGTVRGRIGYRLVGDSLPFTLGAYIGIRHYSNNFSDDLDEAGNRDSQASVSTPESEVIGLEKRFTSGLEPGLEFGMAF